jgi:hypothetical protein
MKTTANVKFKKWDCNAIFAKYITNGRGAISLTDKNTSELIATCTVNIENEPIEENEVIIKNYAENEGMYSALVKAGIISSVKRYVNTGYVIYPVCELLPKKR